MVCPPARNSLRARPVDGASHGATEQPFAYADSIDERRHKNLSIGVAGDGESSGGSLRRRLSLADSFNVVR